MPLHSRLQLAIAIRKRSATRPTIDGAVSAPERSSVDLAGATPEASSGGRSNGTISCSPRCSRVRLPRDDRRADQISDIGRGAGPLLGNDVGDRLRKRPAVAAGVLGRVLAFSVGLVCRWVEDSRAALTGPLVVAVHVLDPHHHGVAAVARRAPRRAVRSRRPPRRRLRAEPGGSRRASAP
jgi:hypothetical protein